MEGRVLLSCGTASASVPTNDDATAILSLPDGRTLVAGDSILSTSLFESTFRAAFVMYNADGSVDSQFGVDGEAVVDDFQLTVGGMALSGDQIIVVGSEILPGGEQMVVFRLNSDGSLDETFGSGGRTGVPFTQAPTQSKAAGVVVHDTKIVVAGHGFWDWDQDFVVARLNADGTPDATFGNGAQLSEQAGTGVVRTNVSASDHSAGVAIDSQTNQIVLGGASLGSFAMELTAVRYKDDGARDETFGNTEDNIEMDGVVRLGVGDDTDDDWAVGVSVSDGKVLLAGTADVNGWNFASRLVLARYNADGSLDKQTATAAGFGDIDPMTGARGGVTLDYLDAFNDGDTGIISVNAAGMKMAGDNVLVTGVLSVHWTGDGRPSTVGITPDIAVVRYTADGSRDKTFGAGGSARLPYVAVADAGGNGDEAGGVTVDQLGRVIVAGTSSENSRDFATLRFSDTGTPIDVTLADFGTDGTAPGAEIGGAPGSSDEGVQIDLTNVCGGSGTWAVTKDGAAYGSGGTGAAFGFTPDDNGSYVVTLEADGSIDSRTITVNNVAPTPVELGADFAVDQGTSVPFSVTSTDVPADTVTITWAVTDASGNPVATGSGSAFTFDANAAGVYTVAVTASDEDGGTVGDSVVVTVNSAAVLAVDAGADQAVGEGATASFTAALQNASADALISWSVSDGVGVVASGSGASFSFLPADDGAYVVTVTATDGAASATDSLILTVSNAAPVPAISGASVGVRQWDVVLAGSFSDAGTADTHTLAWQVTDAAGAVVAVGNGSGVRFLPVSGGIHTVTFTVTDDDGGVGAAQHQVDVHGALIVNGGVLRVGGTAVADGIVLMPTAGGQVDVLFDGVSAGLFTPTISILVRAGGGADDVTVASGMPLPTRAFGGTGSDFLRSGNIGDSLVGDNGSDTLIGNAGRDVLVGGDGHDILIGGGGNDLLNGGRNDDILIGGRGADSLDGDSNDDVIIAGYTSYDKDLAKLGAILVAWRGRTDYASGVAAVQNAGLVADVTVFDDDARDVMTGDKGRDLFFGNFSKPDRVLDVITDLKGSEFTIDLD